MKLLRDLSAFFTPRERWQLGALFLATLVTAFLQVAGIASVMPFVALVADPTIVGQSDWAVSAKDFLGIQDTRDLLVVTGFGVLVLLTLSNAVSALTTWAQLRFVWTMHDRLSGQLLARYLDQPYVEHINRNSADLGKNLLAEVATLMNSVVLSVLKVTTKMIVITVIIAFLAVIDVVLAIGTAVVVGGAYTALYLWTRRRVEETGRERLRANTQRFKAANEALGGFKDCKVLGREGEFLRRFAEGSQSFSRQMAAHEILKEVPRFGLESVAFGGVLVVLLYYLLMGLDAKSILPMVSLYAVAGYKLLPAAQQIFAGVNSVRFNAPVLEVLYEDLVTAPARYADPQAVNGSEPQITFEKEIVLEDIQFRYPRGDTDVLQGISLTIPKNHMVGLIGETGCGKTTLVDVILGLLRPTSGNVLVDGQRLTPATVRAWSQCVGYVPQDIFLCDDTVLRNIAFGIAPEAIDREQVERVSRVANLHNFVQQLPLGYDTEVGERGVRLSGGQRQRIGIARALYHGPSLLVLDEATSALDGMTEDAVMEAIHELAHTITIVLIAHRLTTVQECDSIYMLDGGRIVEKGSYAALYHSSSRFRAMAKAV